MRNRGTAAGVPGEQTYAFSTPYEKTSPSKRLEEGGTHGRCPPPRTTACGTTPHLASPRWGEVPSHRTRWEAGDQVWRRVENLSQKSPKYLDTYFAPLPPGVGEGWDGGAEACSGVFAPPSPPP